MGTRADFYMGRGKDSEWLGSIGWDGYPEGIDDDLLQSTTPESFKAAVEAFLVKENGIFPYQGWPWPWDNSQTTDYAYAFEGGEVHASCFGHQWFDPKADEPSVEEGDNDGKPTSFPDMRGRQNLNLGPQSGVIVVS